MKAVILAGGEGTRLRPLTCNLPKPMVPVVNRPFLEHLVARLALHQISGAVLTLNYLPEAVRQYFGDGEALGIPLSYSLEERPMNTAGAVKLVEKLLDETSLVFNGDIFTDLDLGALLVFHREKGAKVTIALTPVEDPTPYGVVETDREGRILQFLEKPPHEAVSTTWVNGGTYVLEPEVLEYVPSGEPFSFERGLFPALLEKGVPLYGFRSRAYWLDIGTPANYLRIHRDLLLGGTSVHWDGQEVSRGVWVGEGSVIDSRVIFRAPVLVGKGCIVEPGVHLLGPLVLGPGCHVEQEATIEGSVLWAGSRVAKGAILRRCIVGSGCRIGEGAYVGDGCALGDHVEVGAGNQLDRGLALWPGHKLAPGAVAFL
ncbi:MAG: NDP-sugar synthase [Chloroflexi bacterium]|nr:NDP-sugar synthase [Chloroflexota bacterium]